MKRTDLKLLLQIMITVAFILIAKQVPSVFSQSANIVGQDKTKDEIERVANQQLDQAAKKFKEKQYWQSAIDLIFIFDSYSDFSKLDEVIYLLGNSLYEMEIYDGADLLYRYLLKTIPKTPLLPDVILALQKVYYQKKEYQQSLKFYTALEGHYSLNKGMDESRYYASQAYYHVKNYNLVPNINQLINTNSDFYAFGLYTSGLVYLKKKISGKLLTPLLRSASLRLKMMNSGI